MLLYLGRRTICIGMSFSPRFVPSIIARAFCSWRASAFLGNRGYDARFDLVEDLHIAERPTTLAFI